MDNTNSYSTIFYDTVENLKGIQITQDHKHLLVYFVMDGVPYCLRDCSDIRTPQIYEVEKIGLNDLSVQRNKEVYKRILTAYRKALDEYVLGAHKMGNSVYLPEPLKNHLLQLLK